LGSSSTWRGGFLFRLSENGAHSREVSVPEYFLPIFFPIGTWPHLGTPGICDEFPAMDVDIVELPLNHSMCLRSGHRSRLVSFVEGPELGHSASAFIRGRKSSIFLSTDFADATDGKEERRSTGDC
jgi:hypothetical protein